MSRSSTLLWIALALILLLPSTAGRFLIDLAGGLMLLFLSLPLIIGGIGWIGWRLLKSQITTCNNCGATSFNTSVQCPICGSSLNKDEANTNNVSNQNNLNSIPASSATVDIKAMKSDQEK